MNSNNARRSFLKKALVGTGMAVSSGVLASNENWGPSVRVPETKAVDACHNFSFNAGASPVVYPVDKCTFVWDAFEEAGSGIISGSFSTLVGSKLHHSGFIEVTANDPDRSVSFNLTLMESGVALNVSSKTTMVNNDGSETFTEGTFGGLPFHFGYNVFTNQLGDSFADPSVIDVAKQFDLSPYNDFATNVKDSLPPTNANLFREHLATCGAKGGDDGWGFWSGLAACAGAGAASGWCLSAAIDGVGATCCQPGTAALVVVYVRCLEQI